MADFKYSAGIDVNLNVKGASNQLKDLLKLLQLISNMKVDIGTGNLTADIEKASEAAMKLSAHLATATNPQTGNLDFTKFYSSILKSGASLENYGKALQNMGPAGLKAFVSLADSISKAEIPLKRTSKLVDGMWDNLKKTIGWQMSSSMVHGFIGSMQLAMGYAKDLNRSLTDIRIVTGASSDLMAQFAKEANKAAKSLSTTTTDYTKASLIYYQLGLSDLEVKARTETTIKMANATGTSALKVSDLMTAIWNNFDNGTKSLTHYADVMTALGAATASSTDEIAEGLQKFAAISDTVGLSYEYAASALATITSTSRESADVVGNSLKTLFSRIQGLLLGETLDDGTTLNKYSTAMAKVGISIKDSSGELKDMDTILDEMGTKWQTLANDEKMALALTVAGVRQYTQLMTLMENWDLFKSNLNIANTSGGTLDAQAAIYAESWEAASDRVRASWESLWDNLINSDGMITILDGLSGIVQMMDNMITGLGGAGGALATFGGILTKVFNKLIASTISDTVYSIGMLFPNTQLSMINLRNSFISSAKDIIAQDTNITLGAENEFAARRLGLSLQLDTSLLYAQNKDKMSASQKIIENMYADSTKQTFDKLISAGQDLDLAKEARGDFFFKFADENMDNNLLAQNIEYEKGILENKKAEFEASILLKKDSLNAKGVSNKKKKIILKEIGILRDSLDETEKQLKNISSYNNKIINRDKVFGNWDEYVQKQSSLLDANIELKTNKQELLKLKHGEKWSKEAEFGSALWKDQQEYANLDKQIKTLLENKTLLTKANLAPKNFSESLLQLAKSTTNFLNLLNGLTNLNDSSPEKALSFIDGLTEFTNTASNSMGSTKFIKDAIEMAEALLKSLNQETGEFDPEALKTFYKDFGEKIAPNIKNFSERSMNTVAGAIYDTYKNNTDFIGVGLTKEEFISLASSAYMGHSLADLNYLNVLNGYLTLMQARQDNLMRSEKIATGAEAAIQGASGVLETIAAVESLKAGFNELTSGAGSLTSVLTAGASAALNAASGFSGLFSALSAIPKLAGSAGLIAGGIMAAIAAISIGADLIDKYTTNNQEHLQNLTNSNNNLLVAADNTALAVETVKYLNEDYLEGLEKIKSFNQDPAALAENIFESNKKALNLITEYGLKEGLDYTTKENGLIEINESSLALLKLNKETISIVSEYANILGNATNNLATAQAKYDEGTKHLSTSGITSEGYASLTDLLSAYFEKYGELNESGYSFISNKAMLDIYNSSEWEDFLRVMSESNSAVAYNLENFKLLADGYNDLYNSMQSATYMINNAAQVVTSKILADNGITSDTQAGYNAYADVAALYIKDNYLDPSQQWQIQDILDNQENRNEVSRLLEELGLAKGATITGLKDGRIEYLAEGSTEKAYIEMETINAWRAAEKVANNSTEIINKASEAWTNATENYGDAAAEAGFNIERFDTVVGASADSVLALYNDRNLIDDNGLSASGLAWRKLSEEEQLKIANILGDDGIIKALGLDSTTLSEVSMGTLETLQNQAKAMGTEGATYLGKLFEGVKDATEAESAEDLAKIITALSSMDFSDNSYLNLMDLKSTLESFGFSVNTGGLEALYAILLKLAGLGPGSGLLDYADDNKKITKNRAALNAIAPGEAVDEDTKKASGLNENDFVKDENGNYVYTGSLEDINYAKSLANRAFALNQIKIDSLQAAYAGLVKEGMNLSGGYDNIMALGNVLGLENRTYGIGTDVETTVFNGTGNEQLSYLALGLNMSIDDFRTLMTTDPTKALELANSFLSNGSMTSKAQENSVVDYIAKITNTLDMMDALLDNPLGEDATDGNGFLDKNGIISDAALARLESLPKTSERASLALENLRNAKEAAELNPEDDAALTTYDEALVNYDLALAIDAVAAARGLDAEQMAYLLDLMELQGMLQDKDLTGKAKANYAADLLEQKNAADELAKSYQTLNRNIKSTNNSTKMEGLSKLLSLLAKTTKNTNIAAASMADFEKAYNNFNKKHPDGMSRLLKGDIKAYNQLSREMVKASASNKKFNKEAGKTTKVDWDDNAEDWDNYFEGFDEACTEAEELVAQFNPGETLSLQVADSGGELEAAGADLANLVTLLAGTLMANIEGMNADLALATAAGAVGMDVILRPVTLAESLTLQEIEGSEWVEGPNNTGKATSIGTTTYTQDASGTITAWEMVPKKGASGSKGGGGGGGGGGPKEPKKVANKRKSQTVKRYKRNDAKRSSAEKSKKSVENQKDYLYGETKISLMEKINKLAEKEAKITKDRIQESQKYLIEDRENLIKYMQKYGIEAEFDSEGFLKNYEQAWSKIYEEIAVLYEDNLLTEDEEKIEEDLNVKLEELEGVLEDYENSLEELADDIEKYEESLYELYDNKIDAIQHKVEFKIELNEDDIEYIDFLLEVLGDTASYSVNRIELINQKMDALFNSISTIKEGIAEIYDISNDELQVFATGGLDIEGLLTEAQVEKLRELRDQLMEEMQALIEEYLKAMEEPLTVFDSWTEKIDHSIATVEHYSSILSQLRNVIDITGRDMYGFTDTFMRNLETITISQSLDTIAVNREYYESLIAQLAEAEAGLMQAREQGDEATIAKWEEIVRTTTEAAQSAREALVSGLENTLTLISDQFTAALEDAVKNFNDALYASGGLEGLSNDYSLMREHADLMAADYDKIYNLSKLTRNINKSLDDTKIIAGKLKLNSLLEEINALQATGVELSKYDLEYLEAKYNLYLAQIELENARNAKDTVTLSRDSEGNWAYVYTSNEEKIAEAELKYEDALYEMQNKNHEYMEEMSSNMIAMTLQMQEEMAELNPADFANPEEYQLALQEIQDKYDKLLKALNDELNKAIENNASLYETDWKNYSRYTGYKISDDEKWIDSFKETTLGHLVGSDSMDSDFLNTVYKLTTELSKGLSEAAVNYFKGIDEALKTYGTSIDEFGSNIINTTTSIRMESIEVGESIEDMASKMLTAFKDAADALKAFQETRLPEITTLLGEISTIISLINKDIRDSANIINDKDTSLIGDSKAVDLLNESGLFGTWTYNKRGDMDIVDENGNKTEGTNFLAYNAKLIEELDKARSDYQEGKITKEDLDEMYERYWMFKDIINRIYNSDNLVDPPAAFDTGGYTGEWGNAGKLAMLHQKELILNPDDTENFLEAIKLTKDMMSVLDFLILYAKLGMGVLEAYDLLHLPSETVIEQQVTIQAEFPNVSDHNEVEEAIYNLINTASQYANRQ